MTRTIVFYPDRTVVTYAGKGKGTAMVEDDLPKSSVPDISIVQGLVVFTEVDPTLRVFLRSDGETAAVSYTIMKERVLPATRTVELASCSLEIPDVVHKISGDQVILRFNVLQDGRPVYIPLKVLVDGRVITPQFDQATRTYTLLFPATQGTHNVLIRARVEGCPAIERAYSFSVGLSLLPLYLALLVFALVLLLRFARKRSL